MHFHREKGKQILDMRGDFVLSKRSELITANAPSAAPSRVRWARYIVGIHKLGFRGKCRASLRALQFIWSEGKV